MISEPESHVRWLGGDVKAGLRQAQYNTSCYRLPASPRVDVPDLETGTWGISCAMLEKLYGPNTVASEKLKTT